MKSNYIRLLSIPLIAAALLFQGCDLLDQLDDLDKDGPGTPSDKNKELRVSANSLSFPAIGATEIIEVTAEEVGQWHVDNEISWLSVTKDEDRAAVVVTALANESEDAREGRFRIYAADAADVIISVSQRAYGTDEDGEVIILDVAPLTVDFDAHAAEMTVSVSCNGRWRVEVDEYDLSWINVSVTEDGFIITVDENTESDARVAQLMVFALRKNGTIGATTTVGVTQKGQDDDVLRLDHDEIVFLWNADQSFFITVDTGYEHWTVDKNGEDWIEVVKIENGFTVTADRNMSLEDRSAIIVVTAGPFKNILKVIQNGCNPLDAMTGIFNVGEPDSGIQFYAEFDRWTYQENVLGITTRNWRETGYDIFLRYDYGKFSFPSYSYSTQPIVGNSVIQVAILVEKEGGYGRRLVVHGDIFGEYDMYNRSLLFARDGIYTDPNPELDSFECWIYLGIARLREFYDSDGKLEKVDISEWYTQMNGFHLWPAAEYSYNAYRTAGYGAGDNSLVAPGSFAVGYGSLKVR